MAVICALCGKEFGQNYNLNKHIRTIHKLSTTAIAHDRNTYNNKCLENDCNVSYKHRKDLMWHLIENHDKVFEAEEIYLSGMNEFNSWKYATESSTNTNYIFKSRSKTSKGEILYYYCNRTQTGKNRRNNERKYIRNVKRQGSSKMDSSCTSQIKVIVENEKRIFVQWQKTHYGHTTQLEHIRMTKHDRIRIASKLIDGETSTDILQTIREEVGTDIKRIQFLTTKDIYNIKKSFNIENNVAPFNLWVQECAMKPDEELAILFYKQQGESVEGFNTSDFCLIIMNKFQRLMLEKYGSNLIAIDGMHELNAENLELTTLTVLNDFDQAIPVAFMVSTSKTMSAYNLFFKAIKSHVGVINANVLISDVLSQSFYDEWAVVMSRSNNELFSSWHVDQGWLTNLNILANRKKRSQLYRIIKTLQQNTEQIDFEAKLNTAIQDMLDNKDTKRFGNYFKTNFSCNYKKWAHCYRKECQTNTGVQLESMHKQMNYIYLYKDITQCLGEGFYMVVKYLRDKSVEKVITQTKGKQKKLRKGMLQKHKIALRSVYDSQAIGYKLWLLTANCKSFIVQKYLDNCCCSDLCLECDICLHMFSCTCTVYSQTTSICEHIHYLIINVITDQYECTKGSSGSVDKSTTNRSKVDTKENNVANIHESIAEILHKLQNTNLNNLSKYSVNKVYYNLKIINKLTFGNVNICKNGKLLEATDCQTIEQTKQLKNGRSTQNRINVSVKNRRSAKFKATPLSEEHSYCFQY